MRLKMSASERWVITGSGYGRNIKSLAPYVTRSTGSITSRLTAMMYAWNAGVTRYRVTRT